MKKNLMTVILVLLALVVGLQLGGKEKEVQDGFGLAAANAAYETAQPVYGNALTATIDGAVYSFEMTSAKVDSFSKSINVKYEAYNPRGEKAYRMTLIFPGDVAPGQYASSKGEKALNITFSDGKFTRGAFVGSVIMPGQGSYNMTLNSRSADWRTYQGSFSAVVTMSNGDRPVRIENANFSFTLGE